MTLEAASRSAVVSLSMLASIAILGVVASAAYQDTRHDPEPSEPPLIRVPQLPWKLPPASRLDDPRSGANEPRGLDRLLPEAGDEPAALLAGRLLAPQAAAAGPAPAPAIQPSAAASEPLPAAKSAMSEPLPAAPAATSEPLPAAAPLPASPGPAAAAGVEYRVQLLATTDRAAAGRAWDGLAARFGALLADYRSHIEKAELAAGSVYRVQIGPFEGRAAAEAKCAELRRRQATCFALRVGPRS